jgi:hypothetical protein
MPEEHKIFMEEYEKYGNNCTLIAKVLYTQTQRTAVKKRLAINGVMLTKVYWQQKIRCAMKDIKELQMKVM